MAGSGNAGNNGGMEMKTDFKYIKFVKIADKPKTTVWSCQNVKGDYGIGIVRWNPGWRQYCFFPEPEMVFSVGCMQDIIDFIQDLNKSENRSYGREFHQNRRMPMNDYKCVTDPHCPYLVECTDFLATMPSDINPAMHLKYNPFLVDVCGLIQKVWDNHHPGQSVSMISSPCLHR